MINDACKRRLSVSCFSVSVEKLLMGAVRVVKSRKVYASHMLFLHYSYTKKSIIHSILFFFFLRMNCNPYYGINIKEGTDMATIIGIALIILGCGLIFKKP